MKVWAGTGGSPPTYKTLLIRRGLHLAQENTSLPSTAGTVGSLSSNLRKKRVQSNYFPLSDMFAPILSVVTFIPSINMLAHCRNYRTKWPHRGFARVQQGDSNCPLWPLCLYFFEYLSLYSQANRNGFRNRRFLHSVQVTDQQFSPFSISIIYMMVEPYII